MVVSEITLLVGTSDTIIKQDKITFASVQNNVKKESVITDLVLEYTFDDGLDIERPIQASELPDHLQEKYQKLKKEYDSIQLEKVFVFRKKPSYEFYRYKKSQLTKIEMQ